MKRSLDKISSSDLGQPGGVCPLGPDGKVPERYLTFGGTEFFSNYVQLDRTGRIPLEYIPSGIDADTFAGASIDSFVRSARTVTVQYPLQGGGQLTSDITIGLADDVINERLDHTKLLNIGSNTHAQIDTFMASSTTDGFLEYDSDGDLRPRNDPLSSDYLEYDADGDLRPKA